MHKKNTSRSLIDIDEKNIILAINDVEPGLVEAITKLSSEIGRKLYGIVLVDKTFVNYKNRVIDGTGLFEEIICDFNDPKSIRSKLKPYLSRLLTYCCRYEWDIKFLQKATPYLSYISVPDSDSLQAASQKDIMRDRLHEFNPDLVPRYFAISEYVKEELDNIIGQMEFPVIIKPAGLDGSQLVKKCDDMSIVHESIRNAFHRIEDIYDEYHGRGSHIMMIEEFMQGDMYSIDAYVNEYGEINVLPPIKVHTYHALGGDSFAGAIQSSAHDLYDDDIHRANTATKQAIHALGLKSSLTHVELYKTISGWKIIEVAARMGGYREDLYREAYGVNHYLNYLRNNLNLEIDTDVTAKQHAAAINIHTEQEGIILNVHGIEKLKSLQSVIWLKQYIANGEKAFFSSNGGFYVVHGVLANANKFELEKDIDTIRKTIKVEVEPFDD
ncbi:ATP-grasp domain-containing protein [Candidatus Saccharibacteria bacterium]|nr:ATP-grasp domain-containing protein [Candidatus Saccharibacteria bacterium]